MFASRAAPFSLIAESPFSSLGEICGGKNGENLGFSLLGSHAVSANSAAVNSLFPKTL